MKHNHFRLITVITTTIISMTAPSSNALQCFVCCGCNGESSTACGTYGGTYDSYFNSAINTRDLGRPMTCQLSPTYANPNYPDSVGEEMSLASVTPACSQVIYYDTTFNEDLTIKMCMSLEACESQKKLIGENTNIYIVNDMGVFVDVLSVQCCTDDFCNNLDAPVNIPAVAAEEAPQTTLPSPLPMPPPPPPQVPLAPSPLTVFADEAHIADAAPPLPPMVDLKKSNERWKKFQPRSSDFFPTTPRVTIKPGAGFFPGLPDFVSILGVTNRPPPLQQLRLLSGAERKKASYLLNQLVLLLLLVLAIW